MMSDWINHHVAVIVPFYFAGIWVFICYMASLMSGWRLLAKRFRLRDEFRGRRWNFQSASFRFSSHYNGVLTVGADPSGLFLVPLFVFRLGHTPLLVPWQEISIQRKKRFLMDVIELRLGSSERVPVTINMKLAARIEAAAGVGWPTGYPRAPLSPPPPIG